MGDRTAGNKAIFLGCYRVAYLCLQHHCISRLAAKSGDVVSDAMAGR